MQRLREQLDLIHLKERIASNAKMSERLIKLLGQSKGWDELGRDWKLSRSMIRGLKNMAVCELCYTSNGFSNLRMQAYEDVKERLLHSVKQQSIVILSSPKANIEFQYLSRKQIKITAIEQGKMIDYSIYGTSHLETMQIKHDTNSPIFFFGDIASLSCIGQRLTECYFVSCLSIENIYLGNNRIKTMELHNPTNRLKCVDLTNNPVEADVVVKILKQVEPFTKQDLFDEDPTLVLSLNQPEEVYSLAKEKRWIVINTDCRRII